ncbi:GTPase HflX [Synechococcus sp. MIT S9509]|uniref:GTPase HflX n=1 Tax=Synechococcus sp. MIT S9509 TaxID=1801630 RepID=UPI0007BAF646|nr:GTPase HflX [Synechococcus sp. MIT S9509]KZR88473.1 GTPase HflX [Synechococcus sp. MIT S9509]
MKQAHLAGRTRGLRPSQLKQLERLSHRRHPDDCGADLFTLERLAELAVQLEDTLHLLIDDRGVCRLLWVGPLGESDRLDRHLQGGSRRSSRQWRLISALHGRRSPDLVPDGRDAVIALDVQPQSWLRYQAVIARSGIRSGALWLPDPKADAGWSCGEAGDLTMLCSSEAYAGNDAPHGDPCRAAQEHIATTVEQVLLLTLTGTDPARSERELAELEGLTRSAGATTVAVCRQRQGQINPQTLWGKGKLQEAALDIRKHGATLVITDRELTPVQARNLERLLDSPVMDRSELILDIFAQRASSAAGRLQVELAQLRYRLPRLAGRGLSLSRQGGGIGTRGPGETQLEKDRRAISRRIEHLGRELRQLGAHRARLRERRHELPGVALVGYTNAGKSSLLNALCDRAPGGPVQAENILFATLDPTTRRLCLPRAGAAPRELLITDTVGFIRELPAPLMQAFMATLEETRNADQLLLVVDLGDPDWHGQLKAVHSILDGLGCEQPRKVLANQIDRCHAGALERIRELEPEALYLSATMGTGLKGLRTWLEQTFWESTPETVSPPVTEPTGAPLNG